MSKCPFWSNTKENISCYNTCPMYSEEREGEICAFKEFLGSNVKKTLVDNIESEDIYYSQHSYLNYNEEDKVINY